MAIYTEVTGELLEKVKPYMKRGETAKVSEPIEYSGNKYRKVVFKKGALGNIKGEENGFIYINERGDISDKTPVQREITRLTYYQDIFFDEENRVSIFKAVQNEADIIKDENDYLEAERGIVVIGEKHKEGISEVIEIVKKVPELRKKNNEKLNEVVDIVNQMKEQKVVFSEKCLHRIYEVYKEALLFNFEKVKVIVGGREYYNTLKKQADKRRRIFSLTLRRRDIGALLKANYIMGYFERVVDTYKQIIDMNKNDYIKFLKECETKNIDNKMKFIRNKK